MQLANAFILISCIVTFTTAMFLSKQRGQRSNAVVNLADKTPKELLPIFSSSIIYWDLDESDRYTPSKKSEMKQTITKELADITEDSKSCGCPRNFGTFVCASNGKLYANMCTFHCGFAESKSAGITPIMIFTETGYSTSWTICESWYRGDELSVNVLQG